MEATPCISEGDVMDLIVTTGTSYVSDERRKEPSDAVLVSMAKAGDADAFVELSQRYYKRIVRRTYRITRNHQDAEDSVQDALLQAFSHLQAFQEKCSFATWLTRIADNAALMVLRKRRRRSEIEIDGTDVSGGEIKQWQPKSHAEDAESRYVRQEREELLKGAILGLPLIARQVVELRRAKGHTAREIAEVLGISQSAVKSRIRYARVRLRKALSSIDPKARSYAAPLRDGRSCRPTRSPASIQSR
jgi:RNA polymerase sigma-70 factor (ECF subfamily)